MKSSPKTWNVTIHRYLLSKNFQSCKVENCLYRRLTDKEEVLLVLYVDDILYTASTEEALTQFEELLGSEFKLKFTDKLSKYLGMEIKVEENKLTAIQKKNINKMASELGEQLKNVHVPMVNNRSNEPESKKLDDVKLYQNIVGQLLYVNLCTRPDVTYIVNVLSRFIKEPTIYHLNLAKRVIRYLKTTENIGLVFRALKEEEGKTEIKAFVDSTYLSEEDLKSVFGFVVYVNGNIVKYRTKKLKLLTESVCESEFLGIYHVSKEVRFIVTLLEFLGVKHKTPVIYCDNRSAVSIANNLTSVERTKHIKAKYLKVQELVSNNEVEVKYIPGEDQVADLLTKPLARGMFEEQRERLY